MLLPRLHPCAPAVHLKRSVLSANHFDTNAVGESYQGSAPATKALNFDADQMENNLVSFKIGGLRGTEGRREDMRQKRMQGKLGLKG
mmetsp:Transcript_102664/g.198999  ORF Transcript_102664/g.198999 Transcript_102664/m.198999 type:complete len:87 (-) Transcript_102664:90-350(-)